MLIPPNFDQLSPAHKWIEAAQLLHRLCDAVPPTDWRPPVTKPLEEDDPYPDAATRENARREIEASLTDPVRRECVEACFAVLREKAVSPLSEPAKYWLRQTVSGAMNFCWSHQTGTDHAPDTKVPFPEIPLPEFLEWLLVDWWYSAGLREALRKSTGEADLYHGFHTS